MALKTALLSSPPLRWPSIKAFIVVNVSYIFDRFDAKYSTNLFNDYTTYAMSYEDDRMIFGCNSIFSPGFNVTSESAADGP